jgi:hypothetical protein
LLLQLSLTLMMMLSLMGIATERLVGEGLTLCSSLFSAGHSCLSIWSLELYAMLVCLQVLSWFYLTATSPLLLMKDPYVPKRKVSACSQWLKLWLKVINTAFDNLATPHTFT